MIFRNRFSALHEMPDSEELAAAVFAHRNLGQGDKPWTTVDETDLKARLERDPEFAGAYRRVEQSWALVGKHATSAKLTSLREQAISRAQRASARRCSSGDLGKLRGLRVAASIAAVCIALFAAYQFSPFGFKPGEYRTQVAEQHLIELPDHTRIALDADTRLRVRYSEHSRIVELLKGQAQFSVAKDSARPFKVLAGDRAVVAVGTVFTVEYFDREMHVAMLEGKVAVLSPDVAQEAQAPTQNEATAPRPARENPTTAQREGEVVGKEILLTAGEALRVAHDGRTLVTPKADLEAATAWRKGKVIFHSEPLAQAIRRLNRYSHLQLQLDDPRLAAMKISGVFEAGDTAAFVEAVQFFLPATADHVDTDTIRIRMK